MTAAARVPGISMGTALLLGAGFSRWSCNLPLAAELFDFAIHADNATERRRLRLLTQIYDYWRNANPAANIEAFIKFAQGPGRRVNLVNWYITRRLTDPFVVTAWGRRSTWYIGSGFANQHEGILKARRFLRAVRDIKNIGILTTNYDLVVEYALGTRGFNYGVGGEQIGCTPNPWRRPLYLTGDVVLAKLHGSISWDGDKKFSDQRCGLTGKCLIVPPIMEKRHTEQLADQWELAKNTLRQSDTLVVFGFSFNEYDTAIREFISANIEAINKVVLIDVVDHRTRIGPIFGSRDVAYLNPLHGDLECQLRDLATARLPGQALH